MLMIATFLSFKPSVAGEPTTSQQCIESCIHDVINRMSANRLILNHDVTEFLVLHGRHRPQSPLESIFVCSDVIYSSNSEKNTGAWVDTVMSMDKQTNKQTAYVSVLSTTYVTLLKSVNITCIRSNHVEQVDPQKPL